MKLAVACHTAPVLSGQNCSFLTERYPTKFMTEPTDSCGPAHPFTETAPPLRRLQGWEYSTANRTSRPYIHHIALFDNSTNIHACPHV